MKRKQCPYLASDQFQFRWWDMDHQYRFRDASPNPYIDGVMISHLKLNSPE